MSNFPFSAVLFDLDGTLVDSHPDLAHAVNHALMLEGRAPVPLDDVRDFIGGGAGVMLERALAATGGPVAEARFAELHTALLDHYRAHIADFTLPYPGLIAALEELAVRGCKLAVCTNKLEAPARDLLDALGMTAHFTAIYGGDSMGPGRAKPEPDMLLAAAAACGGGPNFPGRAAMIGDTSFDVNAARNAEMPVVLFAGGYPDAPVETLGADAVIGHFDDLVTALERL